jgi:hypothetical protein
VNSPPVPESTLPPGQPDDVRPRPPGGEGPRPGGSSSRLAVAFWVAAVLTYAIVGAFHQPFFLLGFWESIPFLLVATWIAGRLFPRPVPPLPPRDGR